MKKFTTSLFVILVALAFMVSCNKDEDVPDVPIVEEEEVGYLTLNLGITIEESSARLKEVDLNTFKIRIFRVNEDGSEELLEGYPKDYSDIVGTEIELPTGTYYVDAQNILEPDVQPAAFDQPWYYGKSDNFNIDKEDLIAVDITCTLANYFVTFEYTDNIPANFTTWNSKATRGAGPFLEWGEDGDPKGYFTIGEDLSIEVHLVYVKEFNEPGDLITRDFYHLIEDPLPKTHYKVVIDAVLQDGIISIGISVDTGVTVVEINPTASVTFSGPGGVDDIEGGAIVDEDPNNPQQGFGRDMVSWNIHDVWLANHKTVLWGPGPDMIRASMDGGTFENGNPGDYPNEILDFAPSPESDLGNGFMVFTGSTKIPLATTGTTQNVDLRFEITVTDGAGNPRLLTAPADYQLPASIGGLAEFSDINDEINVDFVIYARTAGTQTWYNFLFYYDAEPTPANAAGEAHTSFNGGFYWSNQ